MLTKLKCPICDNVGRADGADCGFEGCGRYGLDLVYKCLKCNSGLLIEITEDVDFGQPEAIPPRKWFDMEAGRYQQMMPQEMADDDNKELGLMFHSMFGFVYGYHGLLYQSETDGTNSPEQSFFLNALRVMCVSYFKRTGGSTSDVNVRHVLQKHGLLNLMEPIDGILETELGTTNFMAILTWFRNKFLTHELFQLRPLERIYNEFDIRREENWIVYHDLERNLFNETEKLFYELRNRYPSAWIIVGDPET